MRLTLHRLFDNGNSTTGMLFFKDRFRSNVYVFTLEDEYRDIKVWGETRIPAGTYNIEMKKTGGVYNRYKYHSNRAVKDFTERHGVMEIKDVTNFSGVLIHIGNTDEDTAGCILVGNQLNNNSVDDGFLGNSTDAYIRLIWEIEHYLLKCYPLSIEIIDTDKRLLTQSL